MFLNKHYEQYIRLFFVSSQSNIGTLRTYTKGSIPLIVLGEDDPLVNKTIEQIRKEEALVPLVHIFGASDHWLLLDAPSVLVAGKQLFSVERTRSVERRDYQKFLQAHEKERITPLTEAAVEILMKR